MMQQGVPLEKLWHISRKSIHSAFSEKAIHEQFYLPDHLPGAKEIQILPTVHHAHSHNIDLPQTAKESPSPTQINTTSRNQVKRVLELGSGWGEWLCQWMHSYPNDSYFAFEANFRRVQKTLERIDLQRTQIKKKEKTFASQQCWITPLNYQWFLERLFFGHQFDLIFILFPDPWPKKRHRKNRAIQENFGTIIQRFLKPESQSRIYIATDYGPYARKIYRYLQNCPYIRNLLHDTLGVPFLRERPPELRSLQKKTVFEQDCLNQAKRPYWFCYSRRCP